MEIIKDEVNYTKENGNIIVDETRIQKLTIEELKRAKGNWVSAVKRIQAQLIEKKEMQRRYNPIEEMAKDSEIAKRILWIMQQMGQRHVAEEEIKKIEEDIKKLDEKMIEITKYIDDKEVKEKTEETPKEEPKKEKDEEKTEEKTE